MEDQDAHKLKFTLETSGWTDVLKPMLESRLAHYHRLLIVNPEQRTAGYIEALMYVLAWPYQTLSAHEEDKLVKPQPEPQGIGDPYQTINS